MKAEADTTAPLQTRADKFVPETWDTIKGAYTVYRQSVWQSLLFYAGQFWIEWNADRRVYQREAPKDSFVPQPNINRFSPWIDGIASNFSSVPEIEALPVPIDDEINMGVADVVNALTKHAIKDNALRSDYAGREDRSSMARQIFTLTGCVFSTVRVDKKKIGEREQMEMRPSFSVQCMSCDQFYPDLEEAVPMCPGCNSPQIAVEEGESQLPAMDPATGQPVMEPIFKRRTVVDIQTPLGAGPRPGSTGMDNTGYFYLASRMSLDEIFERTGIKAEPDNEYVDSASTAQSDLSYWYLGYASANQGGKDQALFVEFWCEPGKVEEFPEGLYAVMFNRKVQIAKPWAEATCGDHPVTKGDFVGLPTIFFPRAVAFDLAAIQRLLSEYDSMIQLHAKTSAVEPIVVDQNTVVGEITGRADKIIRWRSIGQGSKEPHRMAHGNLDPKIYDQVQYLEKKGESLAATVSVFRGEQPGSVVAASAIAQLRGQAEMQFANPVKNWNNFWKETIRKVILEYQRFPLEELAEIVGKDKLTQINDFINADLNAALEYVATSNGLPRTRDERRQEMMMLFDKGALDTSDHNVRQKIFELFGETGMMKNFSADATRVRMNIRKMREGQPAEFRPGIDDMDVHLSLAADAAKSMDFDQWPPDAQQALYAYILGIRDLQQQEAAAEAPPDPKNKTAPAKPAAEQGAAHV